MTALVTARRGDGGGVLNESGLLLLFCFFLFWTARGHGKAGAAVGAAAALRVARVVVLFASD